jgi:hypothetical protein
MAKKIRNRHMLAAMAEATKKVDEEGPKVLPNRVELRQMNINLTRRTGRPNARIKKARAKHKPQED